MQQTASRNINAAIIRNHKHRKWLKIVTALMAVVVFWTTYAMILPAITLTAQPRALACPITPHTHTVTCYDINGNLTCTDAAQIIHTHDANCYTDDGQLACQLPELAAHAHTDACYTLVLTCTDTDSTSTSTDSTHTHTDACYTRALTCGQDEVIAHTHTDACYTTEPDPTNSDATIATLTCGKAAVLTHQHSDDCFIEITSEDSEGASPESTSAEDEAATSNNGEGSSDTALDTDTSSTTQPEGAPAAASDDDDDDDSAATDAAASTSTATTTTPRRAAARAAADNTTFSWEFVSESATLYLCGSGAMPDYPSSSEVPWESHAGEIKTVIMDDTLTYLGKYALSSCKALTSVHLSNSLTAIGAQAFKQCISLEEITFPETLTTIGDSAFSNCAGLLSAPLPQSLTTIGKQAFVSCSSLQAVTFPSTLTTIGDKAYNGCSSLRELTIPASITSLGTSVFDTCTSLQRVTFAPGLTELPESIFNYCTALTEVTLPDTLLYIDSDAFKNCTLLDSINLPSNLLSLGDRCFFSCSALGSITLPNTLTTIGLQAFSSCTAISSIDIPEGVTTIGQNAFQSCSSLLYANVPSTITSMGSGVFSSCSKLVRVSWPESLNIPVSTFSSCSALTTFNMPTDCTQIGASAFYGCSNVLLDVLPENLTEIGTSAFNGCSKATFDTLPETLTTIGVTAFTNCSQITISKIPDSVTSIGNSAFSNCYKITSLKLSGNQITTGQTIAANCYALNTLTIDGPLTDMNSKTLGTLTGLETIVLASPALSTTIANTDLNALKTICVDTSVNTLYGATLNSFRSASKNSAAITLSFNGPNIFNYSGDATTFGNLTLTEGTYYADENGALYRLNTQDNTAQLLMVPKTLNLATQNNSEGATATLTQLLAPTITATEGIQAASASADDLNTAEAGTYTLTEVGAFAFSGNTTIDSVTIPAGVSVGNCAFANCTNLASVNGKTTLTAAINSISEGSSSINAATLQTAFMNTALADASDGATFTSTSGATTIDTTGTEGGTKQPGNQYTISVSATATSSDLLDTTNTQQLTLLTGKNATITFTLKGVDAKDDSASTSDASTIKDNLRFYILTTDAGACSIYDSVANTLFGYPIDEEQTFTTNGSNVTGYFRKTDQAGLYYIEIPAAKTGDTLALGCSAMFANNTSGGSVLCWPDNTEGTATPDQVTKITWTTNRNTITLAKAGSATTFSLKTASADSTAPSATSLKDCFNLKNTSSVNTSYGFNAIDHVQFTNTLTLPSTLSWRSDIIDAIKNGQLTTETTVTGDYYYTYIYALIDGQKVEIANCYVNQKNSALKCNIIDNLTIELNSQNQPVVSFTATNPSTTAEITNSNFFINYASDVILLTNASALGITSTSTKTASVKITSVTTATKVWRFGEQETDTLTTTKSATVSGGKYTFTKTAYNPETESTSSVSKRYMNNYWPLYLRYVNSSIFSIDTITKTSDTLAQDYYISPANIEEMFNDTYGKYLTITINNIALSKAHTAQVKSTNGKTVTTQIETQGINTSYGALNIESTIIDPCDEQTATVTINSEGALLNVEVVITGGSTNTYTVGAGADYESLEDLFESLRFAVNKVTTYGCQWDWPDDTPLLGGQSRLLIIRCSLKDSFMMLESDTWTELISTNYNSKTSVAESAAYSYEGTTSRTATAPTTTKIGDATLAMDVYNASGANIADTSSVNFGDIVKYKSTVKIASTNGETEAIPFVDKLSEGHVLLVPVSTNPSLGQYGLETCTNSQTKYYKLNREGVYTDIKLGSYIADEIVVTATDSGYETLIKFYMEESKLSTTSFSSFAFEIFAIIDFDTSSEDTDVNFTVSNQGWVGDHQAHRLYAACYRGGTLLLTSKYAVTNYSEASVTADHNAADDVLESSCVVAKGQAVTYRMDVSSIGTDTTGLVLHGGLFNDLLPKNTTSYWDKSNVSITYMAAEDADFSVSDASSDAWYIEDDETTENQQVLRWNSDFTFAVNGTAYIYVTLQFPAEDAQWEALNTYVAGGELTNTWKVGNITRNVTHTLATENCGVLQKGVWETGVYRTDSPNAKKWVNYSNDSRMYYSNNSSALGYVTYYIVLYNAGAGRMYLDTIQDVLPKGFTRYNWDTAVTANKSTATAVAKATGLSESIDWGYLNFTIGSETNSDGNTVLKIDGSNTNSSTTTNGSKVNWDSELKKYYLLPSQGLAFTYSACTNTYDSTEDIAENCAAMPVYDQYKTGTSLYEGLEFSPVASDKTANITENNGEGLLLTNAQAAAEGAFATSYSSDTMWLASSVQVERGHIKPGIQVTSTTPQTSVTDVASWRIDVRNFGELPLMNYTVTDVMMKPYKFTGDIKYEVDLDVPDGVSGSDVNQDAYKSGTICSASDLPAVGESAQVAVDGLGDVLISVSQSADGSNVLTFKFSGDAQGIPANGSLVLLIDTVNSTNSNENKDYINTAYLTPEQSFSKSSVQLGNYVLYDINDEVDAGALPSVTYEARTQASFGYATTSKVSVAELDDDFVVTDNTAAVGSGAVGESSIVAGGLHSNVRYTFTVDNSGSTTMAAQDLGKFLVASNLPEVSDTDTLYDNARYSQFKVNFADSDHLGFEVAITDIATGVVSVLDSAQYTLQFSTASSLNSEDEANSAIWDGSALDAAAGWYTLDEIAAGAGAGVPSLSKMRSFRVLINDEASAGAAAVVAASSSVSVSFNAQLDADAQLEADAVAPSEALTAYNGFGYAYNVSGVRLRSSSENVAVKTPSVPVLEKSLVDYAGAAVDAGADQSFAFVIFEGTLAEAQAMGVDMDELTLLAEGPDAASVAKLTAEGAAYTLQSYGVRATYVVVNVLAGQDSGSVALNALGTYDGQGGSWAWTDGQKYTVFEIDPADVTAGMQDAEPYKFYKFDGVSAGTNMYEFTYESDATSEVVCKNKKATWNIQVNKVEEHGGALADAWFGLYSANQNEAASDDAVASFGVAAAQTVEAEGATWYLVDVACSNAAGLIEWDGLSGARYYVKEVQAPSAYSLGADSAQVVVADYAGDAQVQLTVVNSSGYELPESGGMGDGKCVAAGCAVIAFATLGLLRSRRHHPSTK